MAVYKEINRADGSGVTTFYRISDILDTAETDDKESQSVVIDYNQAKNKPSINGVALVGNKTSEDLGLQPAGDYITNNEADEKFIDEDELEAKNYVNQTELQDAIAHIEHFHREIVEALPVTGMDNVLYMVRKGGTGGDIYNEYIWVGLLNSENGYEFLGTTATDLTDYYKKSQVDAALATKVDKEGGKGLSEENYTLAEKTKLAGLKNYDDTEIQAAVSTIYDELNKRLKYKGHVNSKEDLPTAGQVSGEAIEPNAILYSDIYTSPNQYTKQNALPGRNTDYKYYVAAGSSWNPTNDSDAWYSGCVNTNYEETIDGICFGEYPAGTGQSKKSIIFVHVNASSTKPCWVKGRNTVYVYDEQGTETRVYSNNLITYPCWVNIQGTRSPGCLYGNITNPLKLKYWDIASVGSIQNINNKTITRADFLYNPGYKMFKFDLAGDENAVTVTTTPSDINENDVYTVGANYDLVRGNVVEQKWEPLAPKSDLYKTYTGYDETKTQVLKNINGTLTWVEETQN